MSESSNHEENMVVRQHFQSSPCVLGCRAWCSKFFWEGQLLDDKSPEQEHIPTIQKLLLKNRRIVAMIIPVTVFHFCWWSFAIGNNIWALFKDKYFMTITMILGGVIGGMTSEGGGAIAFPVMTLAFNIEPAVARDFSLMIQSCGMTAAAFTIFFMKVKLEWHSLAFCSLGGVAGTIFGLHLVDPYLSSSMKKMCFVTIWWSSSITLFVLNIIQNRTTCHTMSVVRCVKIVVMLTTGFLGGIFTSFSGSGINICSFSILTLLFRISEKVATPTAVVLMAGNSLVGFFWRALVMRTISSETWEFMAVCVPVVVISAPFGSVLGSHFHRHILAALVCIIDTAALIGAFVLVEQTAVITGASIGIICGGCICFGVMNKIGGWILNQEETVARHVTQSQPSELNISNMADSQSSEMNTSMSYIHSNMADSQSSEMNTSISYMHSSMAGVSSISAQSYQATSWL